MEDDEPMWPYPDSAVGNEQKTLAVDCFRLGQQLWRLCRALEQKSLDCNGLNAARSTLRAMISHSRAGGRARLMAERVAAQLDVAEQANPSLAGYKLALSAGISTAREPSLGDYARLWFFVGMYAAEYDEGYSGERGLESAIRLGRSLVSIMGKSEGVRLMSHLRRSKSSASEIIGEVLAGAAPAFWQPAALGRKARVNGHAVTAKQYRLLVLLRQRQSMKQDELVREIPSAAHILKELRQMPEFRTFISPSGTPQWLALSAPLPPDDA